jgi:hypothetical protein
LVLRRIAETLAAAFSEPEMPAEKGKKYMTTLDHKSIEEKLAELEKIWVKSRTYGRGRFGFYRYLRAVYDWYAELRSTKGLAKKVRDEIIKVQKLSKKLRQNHPINVIIAATSKEDKRTQSRWAQALRYVWKYREQRGRLSLADFLKKNGGPAGCASKLSKAIKPKT